MNRFLRGHRVLKVEAQFCAPAWSFCVCWLEHSAPADAGSGAAAKGGDRRDFIDYKKLLPPDQFIRFARLRDERKAVSDETRIPVIQ
jgi:hypothetical protein